MTEHPSLTVKKEPEKVEEKLDFTEKFGDVTKRLERHETVLAQVIQELDNYSSKIDHLTDLMIKYLERRT